MSQTIPTVQWHDERGNIRPWNFKGREDQAWGLDQIGSQIGIQQHGASSFFFEAPDGNTHDTMRDLFRIFRLRGCACDRQVDQLEHMRQVLTLVDAGAHRADPAVLIDTAFDRSRGWFEHYMYWLETLQFLECDDRLLSNARMSAEGKAVLRMLDLTAPGANEDMSPRAVLSRLRAEQTRPKG